MLAGVVEADQAYALSDLMLSCFIRVVIRLPPTAVSLASRACAGDIRCADFRQRGLDGWPVPD
jgi:hypothetical protein